MGGKGRPGDWQGEGNRYHQVIIKLVKIQKVEMKRKLWKMFAQSHNITNINICLYTSRVKVNPKYYRPTEVDQLLGDPTKAKTRLGWKPKVTFQASS